MDFGQLFNRSWKIVWQNKFLFILGFLAALGAGSSSGSSGNTNFDFPSSSGSASDPLPFDFMNEVSSFWAQYSGLIIGLGCFLFILGIVFWLIRLAAQGGLIEAVDRIDAGEEMSFGSAFSAGVGRIGSLVGLNLLINAPLTISGLVFGGIGIATFASIFQNEGAISDATGGLIGTFAICAGLLACLLIPLSIIITFVQPFAQRGLMIKQLGVVDSIKHGWLVLRENLSDILLLGFAFLFIGFLFGIATLFVMIPFAFLTVGPFFYDAILGNEFSFGTTEIVTLALGGICLGLVSAAVNSALTTYRSATVTLAYQEFIQKDTPKEEI